MKLEEIRNISVIGAGIMGHGIAQVFANSGHAVKLTDADRPTLDAAIQRIRQNLVTFVQYGLISADDVPSVLARIRTVPTVEEAAADADFVVESIVEDLEAKRTLFNRLDGICPDRTILASNSSSFPISDIASQTGRQDRVILTHWFNPPHIVPAVEIMPGRHTSDGTFELVYDLHRKAGKLAIRIRKEVPGCLVNRIQMAMLREVWSLWEMGVASAEDIDLAVKGSFGFRLASIGPLMTNDLGGNDTNHSVASHLFPLINSDVQPPRAFRELVESGRYGRKSGRGFYSFTQEQWQAIIEKRDREFLQRLKALYNAGGEAPDPSGCR